MRTLIVEDDRSSAEKVMEILEELGWEHVWCSTFADALARAKCEDFSLLILDRLLGDGSGDAIALLDMLKQEEINPAVVVLSSLGSTQQRIVGLDRGGDAYVTKPFIVAELRSILLSIGRRLGYLDGGNTIIQLGKLEVRTRTRLAIYAGEELVLTSKTYLLLKVLAENAGEVVSRDRLWREGWPDFVRLQRQDMPLEQAMRRLRVELRRVGGEEMLQTVRGKGYVLSHG